VAKFLNTQGLKTWIPKLIEETERELIVIVPFIQTSDKIYQLLSEADARGVETTIIYREDKLNQKEREKLQSIDNLNLMHHPNVHAKCYYNGRYLIIGSMNLYEFSEKNNREMGILISPDRIKDENGTYSDSDRHVVFNDAVLEIRTIMNAASLEKASRETREEGFIIDIIQTEKEKLAERCKVLNKYFGHKKFEVHERNYGCETRCYNYFDKIDIVPEEKRIAIYLNYEEQHASKIYREFQKKYDIKMLRGFSLYWNEFPGTTIYLYPQDHHKLWKEALTEDQRFKTYMYGLDLFYKELKPLVIERTSVISR
jgi:hypothetical protein